MNVKYFLLTPEGFEIKQFNTKETALLDIAFKEVGNYNLDTFLPWLPSKYIVIYDDGDCEGKKENLLASELTRQHEYANAILVKVKKNYKTRDSYSGIKSLSRRDVINFSTLFNHIQEVKDEF